MIPQSTQQVKSTQTQSQLHEAQQSVALNVSEIVFEIISIFRIHCILNESQPINAIYRYKCLNISKQQQMHDTFHAHNAQLNPIYFLSTKDTLALRSLRVWRKFASLCVDGHS